MPLPKKSERPSLRPQHKSQQSDLQPELLPLRLEWESVAMPHYSAKVSPLTALPWRLALREMVGHLKARTRGMRYLITTLSRQSVPQTGIITSKLGLGDNRVRCIYNEKDNPFPCLPLPDNRAYH
jgi:hypothetical protein